MPDASSEKYWSFCKYWYTMWLKQQTQTVTMACNLSLRLVLLQNETKYDEMCMPWTPGFWRCAKKLLFARNCHLQTSTQHMLIPNHNPNTNCNLDPYPNPNLILKADGDVKTQTVCMLIVNGTMDSQFLEDSHFFGITLVLRRRYSGALC